MDITIQNTSINQIMTTDILMEKQIMKYSIMKKSPRRKANAQIRRNNNAY